MHKQGVIRKFLAVAAFIILLGGGYLLLSVATACRADAQSCSCSICVSPAGVATSLGAIGSGVITPGLTEAELEVSAYFTVASAAFTAKISDEILQVTNSIVNWFNTFWYKTELVALQQMAAQLSVMNTDQARAVGSFIDAANTNRALREFHDQQIDSHREQRPAENVCEAGTMTGGMTRATAFSRAYGAAAPTDKIGRTGNAAGSPSATGAAADMNVRWQEYIARYCQKNYNNGASGCSADSPFAGQDIDVTGDLFMKDTIDLTNPDTRLTVDDLLTNIAEPFVKNPVLPGAVGGAAGQAAILAGEVYKARRQVIYDSLYDIVARRAPGGGADVGRFIAPLRAVAGVPPSMISANPSRNEIMQAMMSDRYRNGKYANSQVDEPENNQRELIIQQALQLMQMSDQLDLMDHYALVLAAQASTEIKRAKTLGSAAEGAPLQ